MTIQRELHFGAVCFAGSQIGLSWPELADSRHKAYRKNVICMVRFELFFRGALLGGGGYVSFITLGENVVFFVIYT